MDSSETEEVIERNLLRCATERGVTALEVGAKFNWSVGVATELLQVRHGVSKFRGDGPDCRWRRRRGSCVGMLLLRGFDFGRIDL